MHLTALLSTAFATLTAASTISCNNIKPHKPFYLTTQHLNRETSHYTVHAVSIFDPYYRPKFLIRAVDPSTSGSLPTFELNNGRLTFNSTGPHGVGPVKAYRALDVVEGREVRFSTGKQGKKHGNFGLVDTDIPGQGDAGCAVLVGRKVNGFTLCDGQFGERVVNWEKHLEGKNCAPIHLVAVNV